MTRILRQIRFFAPSAITFLLGTGSLFFVDIWVGRMEPPAEIADWALFKSLVFPLATLTLLGIDQVVVREPSKLALYARHAALTMVAIAGTLSLMVWAVGAYRNGIYIFLGTVLLSSSILYFGVFRANLLFNMAQVSRDGWKPLMLLAIIALHFSAGVDIPLVMVVCCGIIVTISSFLWRAEIPRDMIEQHDEVSDFKSALAVSWPFCLAAFSLSLALYGEILLLKIFNAEKDISLYFRAMIIFSYPAMVMNTYLATFLGSFIRQRAGECAAYFFKNGIYLIPISIVVPILAMTLGFLIQGVIYPDQETPFYLALLLSSVAGLRFLYTLLTSFVGTLGSKKDVKLISFLYLFFALTAPAVCLFVYIISDNIIFAVATTAMVHWLARSLVGLRLTIRLARRALPSP